MKNKLLFYRLLNTQNIYKITLVEFMAKNNLEYGFLWFGVYSL